jgi:hypoxanthine phosphoribosyltransferase
MAYFGNTWNEDWYAGNPWDKNQDAPNGIKLLSWETFISLCDRLFDKLPQDHYNIILCINSGGLVLGKLAKDYFGIPLAVITAKHYEVSERDATGNAVALSGISTLGRIEGNVLLIDDLVDTGRTMFYVKEHLLDFYGNKINYIDTATIYVKPTSSFTPDYYVEGTTKWIVFPYERKEFNKK